MEHKILDEVLRCDRPGVSWAIIADARSRSVCAAWWLVFGQAQSEVGEGVVGDIHFEMA